MTPQSLRRLGASSLVLSAMAVALVSLGAQTSALAAELERIFKANEYRSPTFGPAVWLGGGRYTTVERSASVEGSRDIVEYDAASGRRTVLIAAAALKPPKSDAPLDIDGYSWSAD